MEDTIDQLTKELNEARIKVEALETLLGNAQERMIDLAATVLRDLHDNKEAHYIYDEMINALGGMPQYVEAMRRAELAPTKTEYQWIIDELKKGDKK